MALTLLSPPPAWQSTTSGASLTSAAFTPPAGALLISQSMFGTSNTARTEVTDTVTGSTSAWTKALHQNAGAGLVDTNWATVTSSVSTTVRTTWPVAFDGAHAVFVVSGQRTTGGPIGQSGQGVSVTGGGYSFSITPTVAGSRVFLSYCAVNGANPPTSPQLTLYGSSQTPATSATHASYVSAPLTGPTTITLTGGTANAGINWVEVVPAEASASDPAGTTSFTGANGDPWPAPWTSTAGATIQSNRGQQVTGTAQWTGVESRANTTMGNQRIEVTVRYPTAPAGKSMRVDGRYNPDLGNGYRALLAGDGGFAIYRIDGWVETVLAADWNVTWAADTDYRIAFELRGTTLRVKRWIVGQTEPSVWGVETTDATYASGDVRLCIFNSSAGGVAQTGLWDNVVIASAAGMATSTWDLSSPNLKEAILRFVSTVENGNQQWWTHFGYIELGAGIGDVRGYTGGIVGWTTGTLDMNILIKYYTTLKPGNVLAKWTDELDQIDQLPYGTQRHNASISLLGDPFVADFQTAGNDPVFHQAQLDERDRGYWNRAYAAAVADGLSPLGLMHYYDCIVNHGWNPGEPVGGESFNGCVATAKSVTPAPIDGGDESAYLRALNDAREVVLREWGDWQDSPPNPPRRVTALRAFIDSGNFGLVTPYSWNMYGTVHTLSAWPDPYVLPSAPVANAVTYRSGATEAAAGGAAVAVPKSTGLAVGDLMVSAYVGDRDITTGSIPALSGWQTAGTLDRSSTTPDIGALRIAWKIATQADVDATTTTFPSPGNVDHAAAINVFTAGTFNPNAPIADLQFGVATTAAFTHTAPSATGVAGGMLLSVFTRNDTANPSATVSWTTTAQDLRTQRGSSGHWVGLATATTPLTAAGATGTKDATASDSSMALLASVVIAPVPAAATGTRNASDSAGATDTVQRQMAMVRTATSAAGATDSVQAQRGKAVASPAGASDSFTRQMTMIRSIEDWAPTTDHAVWTMDRPDIVDYQFVFDAEPWVPFGLGQTVVVENFSPGSAETRNQDVLSPTSDVRWFGTDRKTPPTWTFDMYTDVEDAGQALGWAQNMDDLWNAEDLRSTPNAVVALRYCIAGRIRRVHGRPGNFTPIPTYVRTGRVHMAADFRLAEDLYYEDAEERIRINTIPSDTSASGFTFPITFPLTIGAQGDSPYVEQAIVGGKRPTWTDVTFYGPSLDPWVMIGGQRWQLRGQLGAGESIRMSGKPWQQGLLRNDGAWMAGMLGPQARLSQLRLKPGTYPVKYGAYDPTGTSRAEVAWRAAYGTM